MYHSFTCFQTLCYKCPGRMPASLTQQALGWSKHPFRMLSTNWEVIQIYWIFLILQHGMVKKKEKGKTNQLTREFHSQAFSSSFAQVTKAYFILNAYLKQELVYLVTIKMRNNFFVFTEVKYTFPIHISACIMFSHFTHIRNASMSIWTWACIFLRILRSQIHFPSILLLHSVLDFILVSSASCTNSLYFIAYNSKQFLSVFIMNKYWQVKVYHWWRCILVCCSNRFSV